VGQRIEVEAKGLKDGKYTLSLVRRLDKPSGISCLGKIGKARRVTEGEAKFKGKVPARLRCYSGPDAEQFQGRIKTVPGKARLVIGVKDGPGAYRGDKSFVRRKIRIVE